MISWFVEDLVLPRPDTQVKHIIQAIGSSGLEKGQAFVSKYCPNSTPSIYATYCAAPFEIVGHCWATWPIDRRLSMPVVRCLPRIVDVESLAVSWTSNLRHHKVDINIHSHILKVIEDGIETKEEGNMACGMLM